MRARTEIAHEEIFHASLTDFVSERLGQKRSKKKADPKIVATAIPIKILKEAMPTKSSLWTAACPRLRVEIPPF